MIKELVYFKDGLTVKELKEIVKGMKDEDVNGEPCEVWVARKDGLSDRVSTVWPLNPRGGVCDLLLEV